MKRRGIWAVGHLATIVWALTLFTACAIKDQTPDLPSPQPPPAPAFVEFTLAAHVNGDKGPIKDCAVTLKLQPQAEAFRGSTTSDGYAAWLVRIPKPDPGGWRNVAVSIACPGYLLLEDSFVIAGGNQDVSFGGAAAGNQPMLRAGPTLAVLKRHGRVRANGRAFIDDDGEFNPLGSSFFWLVWGQKFDADRMDANLQFLARRQFDYIRIFAEVDGGDLNSADGAKVGWTDRAIDPAWPDYVEQLGAAIDHAYDQHGLRVDLTVIAGGTGRVREAAAGVEAAIKAGREHKILALQIANEDNLPDVALRDELTRHFMAAFPWMQVSAFSSRRGDVLKDLLARGVGNSITPHTDRDTKGDGNWRQVRQIYDFKDFAVTCRNDEPPGPQSSVATQEEPIHLAMTRAMSIIMGCAAYTFHPGAGIRGGGKADLALGRPANFWESPNIDAQIAALVAVGKLIPTDAANWTKEGSHWAGNPLVADMYLDEKGADHGVIALYAAHADSRFVVLPQGIREFVTITSKSAAIVDVFSPLTGEKLHAFTVAAGGAFTLSGPERGGLGGYVIVGRAQ